MNPEPTKSTLEARRRSLIDELNAIGPSPAGTEESINRESIASELRDVNAQLKQMNIDAARRLKSEADKRRARGVAEQRENLRRSGALPTPGPAPAKQPAGQTLGEFLLWQVTRVRVTIKKIGVPQPHTVEFIAGLNKFIDAQAEHCRERARAVSAPRGGGPDDWGATWADGHHHRDDMACPACGTDSSVGCIAETGA